MSQVLASRKCTACTSETEGLDAHVLEQLLDELGPDWELVDGHHLSREFTFKDFEQALAFTNRVGAIAESEGHHPWFVLGWGVVRLDIWTHIVDGLTENDFILAAKADEARSA